MGLGPGVPMTSDFSLHLTSGILNVTDCATLDKRLQYIPGPSWSSHGVCPEPKDLLCDICIDIITDLDQWLTSDTTEDQIVEWIEQVINTSIPCHIKSNSINP